MDVLLQRAILFLSAKKSQVYSNKSQVQITSFLFLCFKTHKHLTLPRRDQANEMDDTMQLILHNFIRDECNKTLKPSIVK